jgi:hypothetical protein
MKRLLIFLHLIISFQSARAHTPQAGKILATFVASAYRTQASHPEAYKLLGTSAGIGIIAEGDVDYNGGVEIALLYYNKSYFREYEDTLVVEKIKRAYITTGYRHWFNPYFSGALSFSSAYSMGDPRQTHVRGRDSPPVTTTAQKITEYGLDFSLQWEVWGNEIHALVLDNRYALSLTSQKGENANQISMLLGYKYLIPKKRLAGKG